MLPSGVLCDMWVWRVMCDVWRVLCVVWVWCVMCDAFPSAEYGEGSQTTYSRRHTLEFSEAECDHPSFKQGQYRVDEWMDQWVGG